jgi:hypothetical protein
MANVANPRRGDTSYKFCAFCWVRTCFRSILVRQTAPAHSDWFAALKIPGSSLTPQQCTGRRKNSWNAAATASLTPHFSAGFLLLTGRGGSLYLSNS